MFGILSLLLLGSAAPAFSMSATVATNTPAATCGSGGSEIVGLTRRFLDAYASDDRGTVLALVDADVRVYGSDIAEVFVGKSGVETMLRDDQRLWNHAATIGEMHDLSLCASADLASLVFDAPFRVGSGPEVPVRFSLLWRTGPEGWRLVQSSNVVPTSGRSAKDLLKDP